MVAFAHCSGKSSGMITRVDHSGDDTLFVLESCHSTWIFDTERLRFRRILKGLALDAHAATTAWRPYFGLEIDPDFRVVRRAAESRGFPAAPFVAARRAVPAVRWQPDR